MRQLEGVRHIVVVPSGPLSSLPFGILVASAPPKIHKVADYRSVNWLAKRFAISVLPAVRSAEALRRPFVAGAVQEPFVGFGDPLVGFKASVSHGNPSIPKSSEVSAPTSVRAGGLVDDTQALQDQGIADVSVIRQADRVKATAEELRKIATILRGNQKAVYLQANATETNVKRIDLTKYRIIAFATHGYMAGEMDGVGEAGLVLTPPVHGTAADDGYLAASEIARLKLNAEWVILSACNTAATDGTPGADGLSGLAKAFFYAGARSLLVSHWSVASDATVALTTIMLRAYQTNPNLGKAEALRKATLALMANPARPEYAHPYFWAPFVVAGEGGPADQKPLTR